MSLQFKKINDARVVPVKLNHVKGNDIKGFDTIENLYANVYICAKKFSGKTNLLFQILKDCSDKNTKLVIICSTVHLDDTYDHIIKHFEKKGNQVITFTSIRDGREDNLESVMETLEEDRHQAKIAEEDEEEDDEEETNKDYPFKFVEPSPAKKKRPKRKNNKKKKEKVAQEVIIVLDDLSAECRRKSVSSLMKKNRHFKCKVIISSQHPNDLQPESLKQLQVAMLFGGHSADKIAKFHRDLDLSIDLEKFIDIYRKVTEEKYSFLYIDVAKGLFRKNLNHQLVLTG